MILFNEMGLDDPIQRAVNELGFIEPTPIQEEVIPKILADSQDLIALAQTGTGKTAAFGLPLIQKADTEDKSVQSLVLCPTRELCMQITSDLQDFSKYINGFNVIPVYGGAPAEKQIRQLRSGGQFVVGTPGRVRDLIDRKVLKVQKIRFLVLDEADEMLQMGFKEELDAILSGTPSEKQTLLFSATMPKGVYQIANNYMHEPAEISVGKKNAGADNVEHEYYMSHAKYRYEVLKRIADMNPDIYGIVFCRTRRETKEVADKFMTDGYNADALHGDLSQAQRDHVMNRFRKRQLQMLVATDVAARGLDVDDLTHVINYNMPDDLDAYIHRSGRTGRAGKSGISISIIHTRETGKIRELEKITKKKFSRVMIPGGKEICEKQLFNLVNTMEQVETADNQIDEFLPEIYKKLDWLSKEELIKKFVSVEFNRFLKYYKNAPDLNVQADRQEGSGRNREVSRDRRSSNRNDAREDRRSRGKKDYSRFYINIGSKNDINPTRLIGLLMDTTSDRQIDIGKIDIMKGFSFFEVDRKQEQLVMQSFSRNIRHDGTKVKVELSNEKPAGNKPQGAGIAERKGKAGPSYDRNISYGDQRSGKSTGGRTDRRSTVKKENTWDDTLTQGSYSGYKPKGTYNSGKNSKAGTAKKRHRKGSRPQY
ncbi:MAG: DEAD/DEAH box helicase [Bacteroidales bacterium]|nr:DEAD/DEAH box helicase [Bacteroidales bacterium]